MQDFRQLKIWQIGHALALGVYSTNRQFPADEVYGITSQMRRCAVSIPANIAEGCGRGSDADFARFLQTAMGSACELEYFLILSRYLKYIESAEHEEFVQPLVELKRMLASLIQRVRGT